VLNALDQFSTNWVKRPAAFFLARFFSEQAGSLSRTVS
jgi:hypothetical protein